jgi:hypothetical protein
MLFVARGNASEVLDCAEEMFDTAARRYKHWAEAGLLGAIDHRLNVEAWLRRPLCGGAAGPRPRTCRRPPSCSGAVGPTIPPRPDIRPFDPARALASLNMVPEVGLPPPHESIVAGCIRTAFLGQPRYGAPVRGAHNSRSAPGEDRLTARRMPCSAAAMRSHFIQNPSARDRKSTAPQVWET